ncbi:hypothetical protein CGQ24_15955 [Arthrobacter sp. 7749]|nr:hypothetical protein CGQ24_15955 [Arthrobacter sp. 7749]
MATQKAMARGRYRDGAVGKVAIEPVQSDDQLLVLQLGQPCFRACTDPLRLECIAVTSILGTPDRPPASLSDSVHRLGPSGVQVAEVIAKNEDCGHAIPVPSIDQRAWNCGTELGQWPSGIEISRTGPKIFP